MWFIYVGQSGITAMILFLNNIKVSNFSQVIHVNLLDLYVVPTAACKAAGYTRI